MNRRQYDTTVRALKKMMSVSRSEREPFYRAAAEAVVSFRKSFPKTDGSIDWNGDGRDYKAAIGQAYREAGVPSDSEDTVQASLRYHVGNVVRETAPPADLEALARSKRPPQARIKREGTTRARKASEDGDGASMPNILSEALADPVGLVSHAILAVEAAKEAKPAGPVAATVRILLRSLRDVTDDLAAQVDG